MCDQCRRLQGAIFTKDSAALRVQQTFQRWKRMELPDETALYHAALDIQYRHGGVAEKFALFCLRQELKHPSCARPILRLGGLSSFPATASGARQH